MKILFIFYTFFRNLTCRSEPSTGFHVWWLKRRGLAQGCFCLLEIPLTLLHILGVKSSQNSNFRGMNRQFQAKRAKYWKFHIIKSTASISTKYCMTIETTKWSSWTAPRRDQKIKWRKIARCPQRFDRSLRNLEWWRKMGLLTAPTAEKTWISKSKMADGCHFENH